MGFRTLLGRLVMGRPFSMGFLWGFLVISKMIAQLSLRAFLRFAATTICHATSRGTGNIGRTESDGDSRCYGPQPFMGTNAVPNHHLHRVLSRLFRTEQFLLILATDLLTNYIYIGDYWWCYDLNIYYKC